MNVTYFLVKFRFHWSMWRIHCIQFIILQVMYNEIFFIQINSEILLIVVNGVINKSYSQILNIFAITIIVPPGEKILSKWSNDFCNDKKVFTLTYRKTFLQTLNIGRHKINKCTKTIRIFLLKKTILLLSLGASTLLGNLERRIHLNHKLSNYKFHYRLKIFE